MQLDVLYDSSRLPAPHLTTGSELSSPICTANSSRATCHQWDTVQGAVLPAGPSRSHPIAHQLIRHQPITSNVIPRGRAHQHQYVFTLLASAALVKLEPRVFTVASPIAVTISGAIAMPAGPEDHDRVLPDDLDITALDGRGAAHGSCGRARSQTVLIFRSGRDPVSPQETLRPATQCHGG